VPPHGRRTFALLLPGVIAAAGLGGFYNALSSSVIGQTLHEGNRSIAGFMIAALQLSAISASTAAPSSWRPARQVFGGSVVLTAGLGTAIWAIYLVSIPVFLVATVLAGCGYGVLYLGAVRVVALLAPAGRRADVLAALNVVNYLGLSIPSVLAGAAIAGLGLRNTSVVFCAALAALAVASAATQFPATRTTPKPQLVAAEAEACGT
jgi:hypothetical protein